MFKHIPYANIAGKPTISDDALYGLYLRVFEDNLQDTLFHDGSIQTADEFIAMVKSIGTCFFAITGTSDGHPVGFWWLNRLTKTHAWCHFVAFKEIWGTESTVPIGKEAMRICFDDLGLAVVMGMIPAWNRYAMAYLDAVGLKEVGVVPGLLWSEKKQKAVDGVILRITQEDLK